MAQTNGARPSDGPKPNDGDRRHMLTIRLPKKAWKRLRSIATARSHQQERNVSCNEVLIGLILETPLR